MENDGIDVGALGGVWRRTLFVDPAGRRDEASEVWWLQVGATCGDIRAPAGAAAETAFAGTLCRTGDVFRWTPEIARGSLTDGAPDEGRLAFEGDVLREDGVHSPYLEHWRRVATVGPCDGAVRFREPGLAPAGVLIEIGPFGFCARPRRDGTVAFALVDRAAGPARLRLAAGCPAAPGEAIDWPSLSDGRLRFPASPLGPAAVVAAAPAEALDLPEPAR